MNTEGLERYIEAAGESQPTQPPSMQDRYRGVLLGVAVGNALGIPVEGRSREHVAYRFPGGLREISETEREAPWDDDLAQTVLLAEAILDRGELDLNDLAVRLVRWLHENGRGCGNQTAAVIRKLEAGTPALDAARLVWERRKQRYGDAPAGNGAVMRCSSVALRWYRSGARLIEETKTSALITHYDPRCVWSAVAVNAVLARCLKGMSANLEELASHLDDAGAPPKVGQAVRAARGSTLGDLSLDSREDMGFTLKAMQVGLWAAQQEADLEKVLVQVVNAGGDTDTNGAVAGALMGSLRGASAIPQRWLNSIRDTDKLIDLADRLYEAATLNTV